MNGNRSLRWALALGMIWSAGCGDGEGAAPDAGPGRPDAGVVDAGPMAPDGGAVEPDRIDQFFDQSEPVSLSEPGQAAAAASYSQPSTVILTGLGFPLLLSLASDEDCPAITDQSDVGGGIIDWRIEGDCTAIDAEGNETRFEGAIVAEGEDDRTTLRYEDFRMIASEECGGELQELRTTVTGTFEVPTLLPLGEEEAPMDGASPEGHFEARLLIESESLDDTCNVQSFGVAYDMNMDVTVETLEDEPIFTQRDVYQMEGRAAVRGEMETAVPLGTLARRLPAPGTLQAEMEAPNGSWMFMAEDYAFAHAEDEEPLVCEEPLDGTLTLQAGGDTVVIEADGAMMCSLPGEQACAPWTLNGEQQPDELCGYGGCSAGPDAPPPWSVIGILLAGLLWQQRRRRRRT